MELLISKLKNSNLRNMGETKQVKIIQVDYRINKLRS